VALVGAVLWISRIWGPGQSQLEPAPLAVSPAAAPSVDFQPVSPPTGIHLTNVTAQSGIDFRHHDGSSGQKYLIEPSSAGLALFDYDGDGWIDIYFVSGTPLPPARPDPNVGNALYRNEGNLRFRDVTRQAGVAGTGFGLGVAAADYDDDGDADLYVNNFGPNVFYRNNGDGTFSDVTAAAGVAGDESVGAGVCFLDLEADGDLDLFAANYVTFSLDKNIRRTIEGIPSYVGPLDFPPSPNVLYENQGDGTFRDISEAAGISAFSGNGMGTVSVDYDRDGDTDVFVANDQLGNFLFENDGRGRFTEVAVARGFAYNLDGSPRANMGLDCADFDGDGWLDIISTTFSKELPVLYRNQQGSFEDVTRTSGDLVKAVTHVKWGVGFADFDNDAQSDLYIANGDLDQEAHRWKPGTAYRLPNSLLRNLGDGKFLDVSQQCGDGLAPVESSRGTAFDDLDNDGDVDAVVLNSGSPPTIIRNDTANSHHWLQIQLHGARASRDGVGAQVQVTAGGRTQTAEVHSGRGYQSHHGTRLHFGLGEAERVDRIEVRWIGGSRSQLVNVPADQRITIREGSTQLASGADE
jgi:hypothetical protein